MKKEMTAAEMAEFNEKVAEVSAEQDEDSPEKVAEVSAEQDEDSPEKVAETAEPSDAETLTPTQKKAAAILRARLPHLSDAALNFEKRTGAFFKASIETIKEADGTPRLDAEGNTVQKTRRTVVAENEIPAEAAEEVAAKRAAALVASAESKREAAYKAIAEAAEALKKAEDAYKDIDAQIMASEAIVDAYVLPQKPVREKAEKASLREKAERAAAEAERLRSLLIAMGINPDAEAAESAE